MPGVGFPVAHRLVVAQGDHAVPEPLGELEVDLARVELAVAAQGP